MRNAELNKVPNGGKRSRTPGFPIFCKLTVGSV